MGEPLLYMVLTFLDDNGFELYAIKSNDPVVIVFLNRRGIDETRFNLLDIALYDGKYY